MHLYLVERTDGWDYDEHDAVVIRAESESDALALVTTPGLRRGGTGFRTGDSPRTAAT